MLDLTNPEVAKAWGYTADPGSMYKDTIKLADRAKEQGFHGIKYQSLRGDGSNYALFDNFDFDHWLTGEMVSPVP